MIISVNCKVHVSSNKLEQDESAFYIGKNNMELYVAYSNPFTAVLNKDMTVRWEGDHEQ